MSNRSTYGETVNAIDDRAAALAELEEWAQHQAHARPRLIAAAWRAGCRNIAELARTANVTRDTVYADLTSQGIDYSDRATKETPMPTPTTTVPTWHHPHFVAAKETRFGTEYQFTAFTGDEPEPKLPDSVVQAFRAAFDAVVNNAVERQEVSDAWTAAENEARAANTVWRVARYHRDVASGLRAAVPAARAYLRAKQAVDAAYAALDDALDGKWRATLLRLVDARETALKAAKEADDALAPVAQRMEGEPERVLVQIDSVEGVARKVGIDITGWPIGDSYDYQDSGWSRSPTQQALAEQFKQQDHRIKEVSRLVGDPE